ILISGATFNLPRLPSVPGDEGVGDVVEVGDKVCAVKRGDRVVLSHGRLGTWRYYGIYNERKLLKISKKLPLPEAATIIVAPSTAYRMLRDFRIMHHDETVVQNAANSPVGQCVIQLCKIWGLKSFNIVANHCGYDAVKEHLMKIGATTVCTLEEAEELSSFNTSLSRPVLALNCLGGRYEDVMLKLLNYHGTIVYYGCAYDLLPTPKRMCRPDVSFHKFDYGQWSAQTMSVERCRMLNRLVESMVIREMQAPLFQPVELKNYVYAIRNTCQCEAFTTMSYIFDFTLP
ncbi:enoyl-[acyl-carrier-protein] reductase, mitochondrial-like, partial [Anticarsia gemmatalis]|uniref:enoyl-[acyl-carrier-protein] reductase, mitochondrial-like n=1 Tax=Anticarsia gemmatalis TaxID=129554 RepID=UPI003F759716